MTALDPVELTLDLVSTPSVNPDLDAGDGELAIMQRIGGVLSDTGLDVRVQTVEGARGNVLGTLPGTAPGLIVMEAHLDTVPPPLEPCGPALNGGRVWGRGACDTKASVAAMLSALQHLSADGAPRPTVLFAGVVDEEYIMRGARELVGELTEADGVIIGEPTNLLPVRAHNGCVRFEIEIRGQTAHSSKAFLGRNALIDAARVVLALEEHLGPTLRTRPHALTGPGLLTATEITGGTAPNVVPDRCTIRFDRRTTPGESVSEVLAEIDDVVQRVREEQGVNAVRVTPWLELPAVETEADQRLVTIAEKACADVLAREVRASGVPYCTDANVLSGLAHVPSIVLGPGSIDQAHAPVEWVEAADVHAAVTLYIDLVRRVGANGMKGPTRDR